MFPRRRRFLWDKDLDPSAACGIATLAAFMCSSNRVAPGFSPDPSPSPAFDFRPFRIFGMMRGAGAEVLQQGAQHVHDGNHG